PGCAGGRGRAGGAAGAGVRARPGGGDPRGDRMRAVVFHGPDDLRYEEIPTPTPAPGGLLLRVEAALTCGTDVKTLRRGHPVMIPQVPTVFGHELAGAVVAVGPGARGFREGDRGVARNSAPCGPGPP